MNKQERLEIAIERNNREQDTLKAKYTRIYNRIVLYANDIIRLNAWYVQEDNRIMSDFRNEVKTILEG